MKILKEMNIICTEFFWKWLIWRKNNFDLCHGKSLIVVRKAIVVSHAKMLSSRVHHSLRVATVTTALNNQVTILFNFCFCSIPVTLCCSTLVRLWCRLLNNNYMFVHSIPTQQRTVYPSKQTTVSVRPLYWTTKRKKQINKSRVLLNSRYLRGAERLWQNIKYVVVVVVCRQNTLSWPTSGLQLW